MLPAAFAVIVVLGLGTGAPVVVEEPQIVEVYPNPATTGDDGEFVTLWVPQGTDLDQYELADDHVTVSLPSISDENTTPDGRYVTLSTAPNITAELTDRIALNLSDRLQLADDGDRIRLQRDGEIIDEVSYGWAPRANVYRVRDGEWVSLGATDRPVVTDGGGEIEAFVLPDEPDRVVELLASAERRILLAGYTLSSPAVVETLVAAHDRGVDVQVLVEGSPVGGMGGHEAAALDELDRSGVEVRVIGGDRARYRYHHAKYAVVDDRALVTTENYKRAGVGGASSRGWGVVTEQERIVDGLVDTYRADAGWVDAIPWNEYDDLTIVDGDHARGDYPSQFDAESFAVERSKLLVAPDNAEGEVVELIGTAEESLDVKQVRIGDSQFPFLQALLEAAARGVDVRILLSGEWYVREENEQLASWLDDQAAAEGLPLEVRIANPEDEFEKIHTKGLIVDGERTLVGSINWNNNSVRNNREVALLIESEEVATYFGTVFENDWEDGGWKLPGGYVIACFMGAVLAVVAARQLEFAK